MAKSKTTKSKTLKAKAVTKAKPKEPGDGVSVLLAQHRKLLRSRDEANRYAEREQKQSTKDWYGGMERALFDRASIALDELSYMKPKTRDGAIFTLVAGYASLANADDIQDPDFRRRRKRRGIRLLYGVLSYLAGGAALWDSFCHDDKFYWLVREYMPLWQNPHHLLEMGKGCDPGDDE